MQENPYANPLPRLQPGRWISTGRVLNYEHWPERERFVELDHLIIQVAEAERQREQERILWAAQPIGPRVLQDFSHSATQITGTGW